MHAFVPHVRGRNDDRLQYTSTMSDQMQRCHEVWTPVDPALCDYHLEPLPKQSNPDYNQLQQTSPFFHSSLSHNPEIFNALRPLSSWHPPFGSYRNQRYDSPSGHLGGNMSEASSDYAFSPELARQTITMSPPRYLSPTSESQLSQQSWTADSRFGIIPISGTTNPQLSSINMKEIEFPTSQEQQFNILEEDLASQLPLNAPEELELSESIATLTTSSRTSTHQSGHSIYDTDSSVSTPVHENDSDSDFDPRRKTSRQAQIGRMPRRSSLSVYPTLDLNNRIHKPTNSRPSISKEKVKSKALPHIPSSNVNINNKGPKSFPCTFHLCGCTSTFANKNEWKRHVTSQHLQLGFYRCDLGTCNPNNSISQTQHLAHASRGRGHNKRRSFSNTDKSAAGEAGKIKGHNDFNRKDLFTQHCRRMHGPARHLEDNTTLTNQIINARLRTQNRKQTTSSIKACNTAEDDATFEEELESIRNRCWTQRRYAPARTACGFCSKTFEASAHTSTSPDLTGKAAERAWEERMEHLGRHYERDGFPPTMEGMDQHLLEWGLNEGILVRTEHAPAWLVGYEIIKTEEERGDGREGLRRRGPRRKLSASATVAALKTVDDGFKGDIIMKEEDSDEDALAEYEY